MPLTQVKQDDIAFMVKDILVSKLGLEESQLKDSALLQDDLGVDSLDLVETLMEVSDKFNLKITDEETEKLKTVGNIVGYVQQKLK